MSVPQRGGIYCVVVAIDQARTPGGTEMDLNQLLSGVSTDPRIRQLVIVAGAIVLALLVRMLFVRVITVFTRRTETNVDDRIARELRGPLVWTIILIGVMLAHLEFEAPTIIDYVVLGIIQTFIGLLWAVAMMRIGRVLLEIVSERVDKIKWIEPRTLPLFDMVLKVMVVGGFLYSVCLAWNVPLTSWLASAGVIGIVVGFAAKDTLSNLFSGIFIVADTPYKIGDFVVLDNTIRGEVLEIGMRSTRLLTRDDIEVTVPNAVIANGQIVNQTGGPHEKMRVRVKVEAAYGSDVDQVEEVLLGCVEGVEHVVDEPSPRVRFRSFGASGLVFELLAWIEKPVFRGRVLHALNGKVYKAFNQAGIEIPYSKQDVYVKELPGRVAETS
jgi:small-conductance mechanosensitive channel